MIKRFLTALALVALVLGAANSGAVAQGRSDPAFTDLYAFGDSLTDTGNLFFLSSGTEPPLDKGYFNGRFSNGPVWIESFAPMLGLSVDFATPFARNQAIGGAFTDLDGLAGPGTGVLGQVASFVFFGGTIEPDDLVVVWAGANNYLAGEFDPTIPVGDLAEAITRLNAAGAMRFLVPNLPNLGDTPGGRASGFGDELNALTAFHNAALAESVAALRAGLGVEIVMVDVNRTLSEILAQPQIYGFDNTEVPCLDGDRNPTGACPVNPDGTLDATGVLFWDGIHPTAAAHAVIAKLAHATLVATLGLPRQVAERGDIATLVALGQVRAFTSTLRHQD